MILIGLTLLLDAVSSNKGESRQKIRVLKIIILPYLLWSNNFSSLFES